MKYTVQLFYTLCKIDCRNKIAVGIISACSSSAVCTNAIYIWEDVKCIQEWGGLVVNMEANGRPDSSQTQGRKTCKNPPKIFSGKLYFIQTLQKAIFLKNAAEKKCKKKLYGCCRKHKPQFYQSNGTSKSRLLKMNWLKWWRWWRRGSVKGPWDKEGTFRHWQNGKMANNSTAIPWSTLAYDYVDNCVWCII